MQKLYESYTENVSALRKRLASRENFDVVERTLTVADLEVTLFFVDGFAKDSEMQRIMQTLLSRKELGTSEEVLRALPYVEADISGDFDDIVRAVLSGQTVILGQSFSTHAILVDVRTYPSRSTGEPDSDRVMQGAHDGFVETLVVNTALIRRRIRDERLRMVHYDMGGASKTDVVVAYIDGVAKESVVRDVKKRLNSVRPKSLTLGFQSLAESLIRSGWFNPFPKIRTTERPDTAAAHLVEGSVLVIVDTSPQVMILPTSIFDYLSQADDFYFPPLTGSYLRLVRTVILLFSVVVTPLWYLYLEYATVLPSALLFLVPDEPGAVPIILQLFLVEFAIDGLKIASMNTPGSLSNSLSIVGALILGDFAVEVGWLSSDVILYMAFIAIATFAQQNHELGYAFKFMRLMILGLVYFFGIYGFVIGIVLFCVLIATNKTLSGRRYLYPLIPFNFKAMKRLIIREKKTDFDDKYENKE